jgi:hypothetical protein
MRIEPSLLDSRVPEDGIRWAGRPCTDINTCPTGPML